MVGFLRFVAKKSLCKVAIIIAIIGLVTLTACQYISYNSEPAETVTPAYTPIVMVPEGTALPKEAMSVSLGVLTTQPENFLGEFVEVRGLNAGFIGRPDCEGWVGPPTDWGLVSERTEYKDHVPVNRPFSIQVKNTFDGMVSSPSGPDGWALRNTMMKQVAVWGWVRLYQGPVGCQAVGEKYMSIFYLDAVKLQFLESIEVNRHD